MLLKASLPKKPHPAVQSIGDFGDEVLLEVLSILIFKRVKGIKIKKRKSIYVLYLKFKIPF